jgi:hypothetical protein
VSGERLDSWKAIAEYLQRDVGTARRWERLGLPVRRVPGGRGRSVFAFTNEIDEWLTSQPAVSTEAPDHASASTPPPPPQRPVWPAVVGVGLVVIAALFFWPRRPIATAADLRIEVLPGGVVARDASGQTVWRHDFPSEYVATASAIGGMPRVLPDPAAAVYAATSYLMRRSDDFVRSGELMRFSREGALERTFAFDDRISVRDRQFAPPWAITTFAVGGPEAARRVAVASHHYLWDPSIVTLLDEAFERRGTFVHEGWIEGLAWTTPSTLLIGGFSHARDGGMVGLVDTDALARGGSGNTAYFADCGCGPIAPTVLVAMPRSEVNRAARARFNRAVVQVPAGRVVARTVELEGDLPAEAIYEFDSSLNLLHASFSDSYWVAHRQLEASGVLTHSAEACPDAKGPREIYVWRQGTGWVRTSTIGDRQIGDRSHR